MGVSITSSLSCSQTTLAYEPIIDKLAEVRQGVFQIKQEDSGWVLSIMKAHPLSDDIG